MCISLVEKNKLGALNEVEIGIKRQDSGDLAWEAQ